jgi:acetyltransferase
MVVVEDFQELYDCAKGLALQPLPKGRRVGMVTNGAGLSVVACDAAEQKGILVGTFTETTKKKLVDQLPAYALVRDVVDLTGSATSQDYRVCMEALLEDPQVDLLVPFFVFQDSSLDEGILEVLPQMKKYGKPILCGYTGGAYGRKLVSRFHRESIPFYTGADRIVRVADAMMWLNEYRARVPESFKGIFEVAGRVVDEGRQLIDGALSSGKRYLLEHQAEALLRGYGLPVLDSILARNEGEAVKAVELLGFPIALKIVSPDVIHKSDVGGVVVGVRDEDAIREGYRLILERVRAKVSKAEVGGVLVQQMAPQGVEVVVGGVRDEEFGPVVMFGLGGKFVEILRDAVFRLAPITMFEALEMIREIRAYPMLKGARGEVPVDEEALGEILVRVSRLMVDQVGISEIDLNPIFAHEKGATVADVRILLK